ncbi:MAG TPA: rhodanese-like domain-containing protein [Saprospiraceae bacterium]|nr:rhodanese-like domain-containing protein [Saprospiraceae bacterium]HMQ84877.1 rhodanese-like domain-containing protein [Saprospiraceae bacterium]
MDFKKIISQQEPVIVDVRETFEFSMGHVDGAINIPLGLIPLRFEELQKMNKPLFMYCRSGGRSGQATAFLKSKGIKEVYNAGGLEEALQLFQQVSH